MKFDLSGWRRPKSKAVERLKTYSEEFFNSLPDEKKEKIVAIREKYQKVLNGLADEVNLRQQKINDEYAQMELDVIDGR